MSTSTKRNNYYPYFQYLRLICILAVIVIHVSGANWYRIDIGSASWNIQTFYNVVSRFSVCVFCMISGALQLTPRKEIPVKEVFTHYISRLLLCFLSWVVLYALYYTLLEQKDMAYFVTRLFSLPVHMWYLLMLMGMYLALPVLRHITKDRSLTLYMIWLIIALAAVTLISGTTGFFSDLAGDSYGYSLWKNFLGNVQEMKVTFIPGYLGMFLLGHYIHEYGLGAWHKRIVYSTIPALLLSVLLTIWISVLTGRSVYTFMLETNPLLYLASAGLFAFFRGEGETPSVKEPDTQLKKTFLWMGGHAFGVYLIHFIVLDSLDHYLHLNVASYPSILSVPINSLLVFAISLALIVLIKKIPLLRKIVS